MYARNSVERLEVRRLLATFTVTNTDNGGAGSLRDAITAAASSSAADLIAFNIPGVGVKTIAPTTPLPSLGADDSLDGTTQPGYAGTPRVEIDGVSVPLTPGSFAGRGIQINSGGAVRGLSIVNWKTRAGILVSDPYIVQGSNPLIEANYIGLRADGVTPGPNQAGILSWRPVTIGGPVASARNIVSGNTDSGIIVTTGTGSTVIDGTLIQNNYIGTDVSGTLSRPNGRGIVLYRWVGEPDPQGAVAVLNNVVAFNQAAGVMVWENGQDAVDSTLVRFNSIHDNAGIGLDRDTAGVDPQLSVERALGAVQAPRITQVIDQGSTWRVVGTVTVPAGSHVIDLYANATADFLGYGEGDVYAGSLAWTSTGGADEPFEATITKVAGKPVISATITTDQGGTSEFSNTVVDAPDTATFYLSAFNDLDKNGSRGGSEFSLNEAIFYIDRNASGGLDDTDYRIPGISPHNLPAGSYQVSAQLPAGYQTLNPSAVPFTINLSVGVSFRYELPAIRSTGTISGYVTYDTQANGTGGLDLPGSNRRVYVDLDGDQSFDANEPNVVTNTQGIYTLSVAPGNYTVRVELDSNWIPVGAAPTVTVVAGQAVNANLFYDLLAYTAKVFQYRDLNHNGIRDANEPRELGQHVYYDFNEDGQYVGLPNDFLPNSSSVGGVIQEYSFEVPLRKQYFGIRPVAGRKITLASATISREQAAYNSVVELEVPYDIVGGIDATTFQDSNANGTRDAGEPALAGRTVYLDLNNNSALDTGEPQATSDDAGLASFRELLPGDYISRQLVPTGWTNLTAGAAGQVQSDVNVATLLGSRLPEVALTLQSELATLSGGTTQSTAHAGYTGTGFADYAGQNSVVTYSITRGSAGSGKLEFRYANGSTANRPLQVLVNNVLVGMVVCGPTGGWTTWANVSLNSVSLPAGTVAIKVVASTSAGGANVDSLTITASDTVTPPPPPPPPPPTTGTDLALNKSTTASSIQASGNAAAKATDGSAATRWSSTFADNQWIQVDIGSAKVLTGVRLSWEMAFGKSYKIQGSNNASNWTDLYSTTSGDGGVDSITISNTTAWRYVRMLGLTRATKYGFSLFDFNVYGVGGTPPVDPPPVDPPPATTGSIGGFLFWDSNKNGLFDASDTYQSGKVVFIDLDGDNVLDSNEKKLTTDASGKFNFTGLVAGTYKVRRVLPSGYKVTTPTQNITIAAGQVFSTVAIGSAAS